MRRRSFHRGAIPAIGESENLLVQWHDIEDRSRVNPPAQGRSFAGILGESQRAKALAKRSVFDIRSDFSDCVHIQRRARRTRAFVCNEEARDSSSYKHEVAQHGTQQRGSRDKLLKI